MRIRPKEYQEFVRIHQALIYYVGQRKELIPATVSFEKFWTYSAEDKLLICNALYDNIHLLEDYIKTHADSLTEEEKDVIRDFKYFERGTFYVVKLTKKYAYFLDDKYVYGVLALRDSFQSFWGNNLPVKVRAVLLPYRGKIVYDGLLSTFRIHFGAGIRRSMQNNLRIAEGKYGVITELPVHIDPMSASESAERELLALMKTKSLREQNWYRIEDILKEHPKLEPLYFKEWGRINSRNKKKQLKALDIKKRWFALHDDTILASAKSEKELAATISALVEDPKKREGVYYFKV